MVGRLHAGNENIKRCTSLIKLAFLVFPNLTLNFGPFKSTLSIPPHRLIFLAPLIRWQYVCTFIRLFYWAV